MHHVALARAVGVSAEQIAAIEEGREDDPSLSETEREVLAFAREVVLDGAAGEHAVAALSARLGPRPVVELLLVLGHWSAICTLIQTLGAATRPAGDGRRAGRHARAARRFRAGEGAGVRRE